jgi:hypothetical protein
MSMDCERRLELSYSEDTYDLAMRGIMVGLAGALPGITTDMARVDGKFILVQEVGP